MARHYTHSPNPAPDQAAPTGAARWVPAGRGRSVVIVAAVILVALGGWLALSRMGDSSGTNDAGLLFVEVAGDGLAAHQGAALTVANELLPQAGLPVLQVQFLGDDMGTVVVVLAEMPGVDVQAQVVDAFIASGLATQAEFHRGAVDNTGTPIEPERYVPWL